MKIKILTFGKIAEILLEQSLELDGVETTLALRMYLETNHPNLKGLHYLMAVDKKIATADSPLADQSVVALLPPFSGG